MEGEFESCNNVVSNGCETNMKKFNFNFKFLDRFKKKNHNDEEVEINPDDLPVDPDGDDSAQFQEMPRKEKTGVHTKSSLQEENFSSENPEIFAERTLNNYSLDDFNKQNALPPETHGDVPPPIDKKIINEPTLKDYKVDPAVLYQEAEEIAEVALPEVPEAASRFKFKFPKFNRSSAPKQEKVKREKSDKNFKDRFNGASPLKSIEKFNWNDFILKLFSPYSRGKIHGVFVILLVVTFTYLLGKSIALFMGRSTPVVSTVKSNINMPIEKSDTTIQDINKISSTNLFNIKESDKTNAPKEKKDIASIVCVDAEKPTSEPLKLLDTIVLQDSVKSVASVQVRGSSDLVNVREGEQLNNAVEVTKINRMKLILKNLSTGDCEYIASEEEDLPMPNVQVMSPKKAKGLFKSTNPNIKNTGNNFKIKRNFRDKLISNMSEVLTQAKAIQITNPDGSLSFKMTEVVPGSIYSNLDIQNDDIITSINGKKIENLNELMGLLGRIKEIDQFQIGRRRNGMDENLEYGFE
jgi:type II secretory pathway component PulC